MSKGDYEFIFVCLFLVAVIGIIAFLIYCIYFLFKTKSKYGMFPIYWKGIVFEVVAVFLFFLALAADVNIMGYVVIGLFAISVIFSLVMNIVKCKKMGLGVGGIIICTFIQLIAIVFAPLAFIGLLSGKLKDERVLFPQGKN